MFAYSLGNQDEDSVDVEMQKCGAYEVIRLSKQRVVMNENPAYGEVGARY